MWLAYAPVLPMFVILSNRMYFDDYFCLWILFLQFNGMTMLLFSFQILKAYWRLTFGISHFISLNARNRLNINRIQPNKCVDMNIGIYKFDITIFFCEQQCERV